jgi:hypothetical protein
VAAHLRYFTGRKIGREKLWARTRRRLPFRRRQWASQDVCHDVGDARDGGDGLLAARQRHRENHRRQELDAVSSLMVGRVSDDVTTPAGPIVMTVTLVVVRGKATFSTIGIRRAAIIFSLVRSVGRDLPIQPILFVREGPPRPRHARVAAKRRHALGPLSELEAIFRVFSKDL